MRLNKLDFDNNVMLLNRGAMAEQFVGQELLAYQDCHEVAEIFFWARDGKGSQAEVDYIIRINSNIVPIEVKSGTTGRLKSLQILLKDKNLKLGVRVSEQNLKLEGNILSVPFYLLSQLQRLLV